MGTLVTTCVDVAVEEIRERIDELSARREKKLSQDRRQPFDVPLVAVSALPELLVVRAFGQNAADVKAVFMNLWQLLRLAQTGQDAVAPRIWFT